MKALTYIRVYSKEMLLLLIGMLVISNHNLCHAQELTFTAKSMSSNELNHVTSYGSSLVDFNLDGTDDITVTNYSGNDYSYINNGDSFNASPNAISGKFYPSSGLTWGDYNNDLNPDLFITTQGPNNHFFQNTGDGSFIEVLDGPHIEEQRYSSHASWVDYNNDGWLDLFIANTQSFSAGGGAANSLFINNKGASFTKITQLNSIVHKHNKKNLCFISFRNISNC